MRTLPSISSERERDCVTMRSNFRDHDVGPMATGEFERKLSPRPLDLGEIVVFDATAWIFGMTVADPALVATSACDRGTDRALQATEWI